MRDLYARLQWQAQGHYAWCSRNETMSSVKFIKFLNLKISWRAIVFIKFVILLFNNSQ